MKKVEARSHLLQCIEYGKCLIKLPKTKFRFRYPQKLVKLSGKNNYLMTIYYTDDTQIYAFRCGDGVHNSYQVIDKRYISAGEFEEYFQQYKIN
jgi:hypothetical protein